MSEAQPVIPPKSNRLNQRAYDKEVYKERNLVERLFQKLKNFRRVATRYERAQFSLSVGNLEYTDRSL